QEATMEADRRDTAVVFTDPQNEVLSETETDQTEDLKRIDVPTLIIHGDDDQIVRFADAGLLQSKLVKSARLKVYQGAPHGLCTRRRDQVTESLRAFRKEG